MSTNEEAPHLKVLREHKHIYDLYQRTGEVVSFHPHVQAAVAAAYRVHDPYYHYNSGCAICTVEMLTTAYKWYETQI